DRRRCGRAATCDRLGGRHRRDRARAVILFLIIFLWTPPHFWALSLNRTDDYCRAGIPCCRSLLEEPRRPGRSSSIALIWSPFRCCRGRWGLLARSTAWLPPWVARCSWCLPCDCEGPATRIGGPLTASLRFPLPTCLH